MTAVGSPARAAAARAGVRVEAGTHLPQALDWAFRRVQLTPRDRGLATEITYGAERWRSYLDFCLAPLLRQPIGTLDPAVRTLLRQGAYQLLRMEMPAYAVVDTTTEAAQAAGAGRARGLLNAVLRRLASEEPPAMPADDVRSLAIRYAHPEWIVRRFLQRLGETGAEELLRRNQETPPLVLRLNRRRTDSQSALTSLSDAGLHPQQVSGLPYAIALRAAGDVRRLPGWDNGEMQVQDVGSQAVGEAISPDGTFVESACGRGTKTLQQAERREGEVVGVDLEVRRIEEAQHEADRLGLPARFVAHDGMRLMEVAGGRDNVLLDAPCSALAVVQRRPDVKWRRREADLARNGQAQLDLLRAALAACRKGGVLTYSVCSHEPEETLWPVQQIAAEGSAEVLRRPPPLAERELEVGYLLPGMYIAQLLCK